MEQINMDLGFVGFNKIPRLSREVVVTEKIDGTNAQIVIGEAGEFLVGSRTRYIDRNNDNHGFANWALDNKNELLKLGVGRHFGEWWGSGINRGYGLPKGEKRWSLFNVMRWSDDRDMVKFPEPRPSCCHVVPVLHVGIFDKLSFGYIMSLLECNGSVASPGFMLPEGIVVYHRQGNVLFKKTIHNDEKGKENG